MNNLQAFHNDPKVKAKYLRRVRAHYKADEIIQGVYWENGKGCAVGCTVERSSNAHEAMEKELGIPQFLAVVEDVIFEELSNGKAKEFPLRFLKAIPVGADLSKIIPQLVIWQFEDPQYGLKNIKEIQEDGELMSVCNDLVDLYRRKLNGGKVAEREWEAIENRAGAGVGAWAWAGAGAGAWAWAWAWAWAGAGVGAGAWAGVEYDNRINILADKLIELLKEA